MYGQNFEIYDRISAIQSRILPRIFGDNKCTSSPPEFTHQFFDNILDYGPEICEIAFGDFGSRLYEVAVDLDFDHPEIKHGQFLDSLNTNADTCKKLIQFLQLCALSKEHELDGIYPLLSKCITKSIIPDVRSSLEFLKNQLQFVRLFKEPADRQRLREIKTARPIELSTSLKKMLGIWETVADLEAYARGGNCYKDQIELTSKRAEVYKQLRLESMYNDVQVSIREFELAFEDQYFDFQRVPMTIVSIILAKMHGCSIDPTSGTRLMVPSKIFAGYDFENCGDYAFVSDAGVGIGPLGVTKKIPDFDYMPMVYPAYTLDNPPQMQEVINYLEAFPSSDGKPIFDHYLVVVPGVHFPRHCISERLSRYAVVDTLGRRRFFNDTFSSRIYLDTILIKEKFVVPALLGEKDGKCYFICFWTQE